MSEVTGKIKQIYQSNQVTDKFTKRDVVVTTGEEYPQHVLIQFVQDKTSLLDNYNVGDNVKIGINIRGREWTSPQGEVKYFNTLQGWRIEKVEAGQAPSKPNVPDTGSEEDDDLPF